MGCEINDLGYRRDSVELTCCEVGISALKFNEMTWFSALAAMFTGMVIELVVVKSSS
jgi:predicted small secreted protein